MAQRGIHHITAIAGDPHQNVDFYVKTLGLRLSLKSVNQDDPGTYHLFYTNQNADPGSSLTFFPWKMAAPCQYGSGEAVAVSFKVPKKGYDFWKEYLTKEGINYQEVTRFDLSVIVFSDPDGMPLELVFADIESPSQPENNSSIPDEFAIQGFYGTTLRLASGRDTALILTELLGFEKTASDNGTDLYQSNSQIGHSVLIEKPDTPSAGRPGKGTIHHVAFRVKDQEEELQIREQLIGMGLRPTDVIDRHVFKSVYFRTPDGVLFELATEGPGYKAVVGDNDPARLLFLPPWLEPQREKIEDLLPELKV